MVLRQFLRVESRAVLRPFECDLPRSEYRPGCVTHGFLQDLPQELGYGSGVTCWRRLRTWQQAGVWEKLHHKLLTRLNAAGQIDWSRAAVDGSHIRTLLGGSAAGRPQ